MTMCVCMYTPHFVFVFVCLCARSEPGGKSWCICCVLMNTDAEEDMTWYPKQKVQWAARKLKGDNPCYITRYIIVCCFCVTFSPNSAENYRSAQIRNLTETTRLPFGCGFEQMHV